MVIFVSDSVTSDEVDLVDRTEAPTHSLSASKATFI